MFSAPIRLFALCTLIAATAANVTARKQEPLNKDTVEVSTKYGAFVLNKVTIVRGGDNFRFYLTGSVTNNTDRAWRFATFTVNLKDKSGAPISCGIYDSKVQVRDVGKGETKRLTDTVERSPAEICVSDRALADFSIRNDESRSYFDSRYVFTMLKPVESSKLTFEDDAVNIDFLITDRQLGFMIKNKLDDPVKISWDEVSYIDLSGRSHRVIHEGTKIVDRERPQPATLVPPTGRLEDFIYPADYPKWDAIISTWDEPLMLPPSQLAEQAKGGTFSMFIPLDIGGKRRNYLFTFKIADVVI